MKEDELYVHLSSHGRAVSPTHGWASTWVPRNAYVVLVDDEPHLADEPAGVFIFIGKG